MHGHLNFRFNCKNSDDGMRAYSRLIFCFTDRD